MIKFFEHIGRLALRVPALIKKPESTLSYWKEFMEQCNSIGIRSISIVVLTSFFVGGVIPIQAAYKLSSPWVPKYFIAQIIRQSTILEFAPTLTCLILAGVVGSKICAELGYMRISEQIDALDIMGINSKGYLITPKIIAAVILIPCLVIIAIFSSIVGGYLSCMSSGILSELDFFKGITKDFLPQDLRFAMVKAFSFALIITIIPAYKGYYVTGGAIEIGRATTQSVVTTCIVILMTDYILSLIFLI